MSKSSDVLGCEEVEGSVDMFHEDQHNAREPGRMLGMPKLQTNHKKLARGLSCDMLWLFTVGVVPQSHVMMVWSLWKK